MSLEEWLNSQHGNFIKIKNKFAKCEKIIINLINKIKFTVIL